MNDCYSPDTGEHIPTDSPAAWMGGAGIDAPEYDAATHCCFWREGGWVVEAPILPAQETIERLKAELRAIEQSEIMPRKTREIQIQLMEFLAAQQGIPPEQLAQNPAYAGMKAIDAQCGALRKQIQEILLNYE